MALTKIVSGGQTGVDRAALDAALTVGFPCGVGVREIERRRTVFFDGPGRSDILSSPGIGESKA